MKTTNQTLAAMADGAESAEDKKAQLAEYQEKLSIVNENLATMEESHEDYAQLMEAKRDLEEVILDSIIFD